MVVFVSQRHPDLTGISSVINVVDSQLSRRTFPEAVYNSMGVDLAKLSKKLVFEDSGKERLHLYRTYKNAYRFCWFMTFVYQYKNYPKMWQLFNLIKLQSWTFT